MAKTLSRQRIPKTDLYQIPYFLCNRKGELHKVNVNRPNSKTSTILRTHPSSDFVIMQVHHSDDVPVVQALLNAVWRVDECPSEVDAVGDIVAAPSPLPALLRSQALPTASERRERIKVSRCRKHVRLYKIMQLFTELYQGIYTASSIKSR